MAFAKTKPDQGGPMDKEHRMLKAKQMQAEGLKQWQIALALDVSERTVRNYLREDLRARRKVPRESKLDAYRPFIEAVLKENPYYNAVVLQERLLRQGYEGKISILRDLVKEIRRRITTQAVIRFETEPGFQAQADWKEFGKQVVDGKEQKLYAFVMILGYSRKMFVCFTTSMKMSVFLACHVLAFMYFGGVPREILYDNMKTAFVRNAAGTYEANRGLQAFAGHYGCIPRRCRIRRPQTKGKVERSIGYLGNNFWQSVQDEPLSLGFLNESVKEWLKQADERPIGELKETRNERFARERVHLHRLPGDAYDTREEVPVVVSRESLVRFESNWYSVHPANIGKMLVLKVDRVKQEADIIADGATLKTVRLFEAGLGMKLFDPADKAAIVKRWEADRASSERYRKPRKKHPHLDIPVEVAVRSPASYDELAGIAAEAAL
jgi:transposase